MRVVVTGDTHLGPRRRGPLPAALLLACAAADQIVHAGDVTDPGLLVELAALAPVSAVRGNCDGLELGLPDQRELELAGVQIGVVHEPGPAHGRAERLRECFPGCRVIVFGHTHWPICEESDDGVLLLNPGSPTDRRRAPWPSYASLELGDGRVDARIVRLP